MRPNDLPRRERSRNQDEVGQITDEANPGLHYFLQGESEFHRGDLGDAIQDFSTALNMREHISSSPPYAQLTVKALLMRAQCFFSLGVLDQSVRDCNEALNVSKEIGFQEGIFNAILFKIMISEVTGDVGGAFQMAVFLKTLDFKKVISHVRRLRENLERIFQQDPTLAEELGDNLMRTGLEFFEDDRFKEAAEYFTEVTRLVCEFHFIRDAYIYLAKCYFELGDYEEAKDLCTTVLERFPDDENGKLLLESIEPIILERRKGAGGAKKKKSNRPSSSRVSEKQVAPQKKPVPNKKQRQREEYRRMKETEEIGKTIREKIKIDLEKQEQKREKEKRELDGANPPPMPSYDLKTALDASKSRRETKDQQIQVQAAGGLGARPKQTRPNEISGKTQDKKSGEKTQQNRGCQKNRKATSQGSTSLDGASEDRLLLSVNSADTERGVTNVNQIVQSSTKPGHGRTPVTSKNQALKSVAKNTSTPDLPSLPEPSFVEDKGTLQGFNSTATKRFSANRVELQKPKSEQKSREHLKSGFADITDYVPRQSPNSLRHLESAGLDSFFSVAGSSRQDIFSTDQESIFRPDATYNGLTESRLPARPTHPSLNSSPETRTVDFGNTPKSQRESLEQISPLQIHRTLDLANKTRKGVLNTKSELPLDTGVSPQIELNLSWAPPPGVSALCMHFLQENRKGQSFRQPKPCPNCTKHSKLMYGIWRSDTKEWQVMRPYPKDVNPDVPFQLCRHFSKDVKCRKCPCPFAHGKEELTFWTSERQSGRAPFGRIASPEGSPQENGFQDLPKPQERIRGSLIIRDIRSNKPRPPPAGVNNGKFQLCKGWKSGRVCRYGTYCTFAHGENELKSWLEIQKAGSEDKLSCQKPETGADISRSEMVYSLPGVEVAYDKPATVKIFFGGDEKRHIFQWELTVKFEISEVGKLCKIDLLHHYHDCYRLTKIIGFLNNVEIFSEVPKERWSYNLPSGTWNDTKAGQMKVVVSVFFETLTSNQTFTQCLRFDFGKKPFLLQGLNVDIARKEALDTLWDIRQELKLHSSVWTERSTDIVPWSQTADVSSQDLLLLREYKLPERIENVIPAQIIDGEMTVQNYKRVMHQLLFIEELFMKKAISSFVLQNIQLDCQKSISNDWSGVAYAGSGEVFGIVKLLDNEPFQPDDAASRLLIRNVNSAWIKIIGSSSQKVYETLVQKVDNECVALKLSSQMCSDLNLSGGGQIFVDVQFQLNRKTLCYWHDAIDRLGPIQLSLLFPTPGALQVKQEERRPWNWLPLDPRLNTNQIDVIRHILAPGDPCSPLVVFGPFGTGKTFTLNQAIRHLVTKKHNRILLCTHTNSAADIHVTLLHDYLVHDGLKATTPLRIYQTNRRLIADSEVARMYGLIENNAYVLPTRDDVIRHRVVITTLAMSRHLLELQLNHGFFTHILVDEAAQALEPEALIPLALAGPNTKVVFTGDHMQMGPEVYSHHARDWGLQRSLPERLFDHYCEKMLSDESVMFLTENYRSHPDILQFPSDNFYGEELIALSEQASHPRFGPLLFFSVHGVEEARENSYINAAEVEEIVKRVELLANDWPVEWKKKDLSQIGVISAYMSQVRAIRTQLRSKGLQKVTVESIHNVQGKEFRALFISTVRTSLTCRSFDGRKSESESLYWEFLSDPKLLNMAITRAMSLIAVVGDPVSLSTAGNCRGNWRDYIRRCHKRGTLHGASYEEILKKIDAPLAKITLNPEANEFVPQSIDVISKQLTSWELVSQPQISDRQISRSVEKTDLEVDKNEKSSALELDDRCTIPTEKKGSGIERDDAEKEVMPEELTVEKTEEEEQKGIQFSSDSPRNDMNSLRSEDQYQVDLDFKEDLQSRHQFPEEEDSLEQSASDGFEEFLRESFEDETVFPRCFDNIIKAFVDKCKWTKEKEDHLYGSPDNAAAFPSLHTAAKLSNKKSKGGKVSDKRASQEKSSSFDHSSKDYEICLVNGRPVVRLVNLGFHQTPVIEHQRLLTTSTRQEEFLDSQLLHRLLEEKSNKYVPCTLRVNSENTRTAYAEVSDTKTPDIKIKGRIRGAFNMDYVVVEKTNYQPSPCDGLPPCQGIIAGVLHHIISPHERHYVCEVDYENPGVMIPINKSVSKLVYLTDKKLKGLPHVDIYKEIHRRSETPFKVDEMDFTEALSGKFLFLVQYLQWRSDCHYPLGIVIKKLPQGETLSDCMRILFAEHGVRERFSKESKAEIQAKFRPAWSIPAEEYETRQKFDGAFTIDPDNSKDLDDALTLEQLPDSVIRVGVHIADVSYFVEPGTQLDKEAMFRSRSYYPGHGYQNVPMLPRELSENHCSLLPGKDRLCVSVFLDVSEKGQLVGQPEIRRTIVRSSCQLTYPEAQNIIDGHDDSLHQIPRDLKQKIRTLSALAQKRRNLRLREASFDHWSNSADDGEDFKAHELVQEMMLLTNEEIAKFLSQQNPDRTPFRTQLPPKDHKLNDWVRQYGQFIKCSLFLRGFYSEEALSKMANEATISEASEFRVQESVWSELCNAAETGDQAKLQKLICNERNHPQLAVANSQFRRIQPKAQYVCKSDRLEENVGHFALGMGCYTQFTSPIRRYIDIQVHRLLLDLIQPPSSNETISSEDQVAKVCRRSTFAQDNSRKFEKASSKVHLAAKLKEKSHETTAVIALIDTDKEITLEILNREYNHLSTRQSKVKLSSLTPFDVQPAPDGLEITWRLRLYLAPEEYIIEEPKKERKKIALLLSQGMMRNRRVLNLPTDNWLKILKAFQEEDHGKLKTMIRQTQTKRVPGPNKPGKLPKSSEDEKADTNLEHLYEKKLLLRKFDIVNIQLTAHITQGVLHPEIQLFKINPSVNICVEHRKYPRECFATTAMYQASRKTYTSVDKYIDAWDPVLAMEGATSAVQESDEFTIQHLKIAWKKNVNGGVEGSFSLQNEYCSSRQIEFHAGDFVCVLVREDSYMKETDSENNFASCEKTKIEGRTNLLKEDQFSVTKSAAPSSIGGKPRHESGCASESFWVGHCIINHEYTKELSDEVILKVVTMDFHQSASDFPDELLNGADHLGTLTVIHRSLPHRRMFAALRSLPSASQLARSICMGNEPSQEDFGSLPSSHLSIVQEHPSCGFKPLNQYQEDAVKKALREPFTLVQGPPGTGKTVTGVHIAYWFVKRNMQQRQDDLDIILPDSDDLPKGPPKVIYCGPSNKSVDVVAKYMLKIPGLKIIRVYGDRREQTEFPIPNKRQPLKQSTDDEIQILNEDNELKAVSLHHVIRKAPCPFAAELGKYERRFDEDRKKHLRTSDKEVEKYCELIGKAECWALQESGVQVILCTCVASGKPRLTRSCGKFQQCIVDECGMCMELESLVPITCTKAQQVVLIGDHKQLQPIIQDNLAMALGLSVSMFERLSEGAKMLELQYRMQEEICRFPSKYFYEQKLKTDRSVPTMDPRLPSFWPACELGKNIPIAFCHVEGEEKSSSIKTAHSNEQSKANEKEVRKVVHVATSLVYTNNVDASKVVILTPYREQRSKISKSLKKVPRCKNIPVTTIVKSQGSEWDYVILSLVRSLSKDEIDPEPSLYWLREHLGFLTDEHQINVGLTRARKGLCIIGNKNLLKVHPMWQELIEFYEKSHCLVNESEWPRN